MEGVSGENQFWMIKIKNIIGNNESFFLPGQPNISTPHERVYTTLNHFPQVATSGLELTKCSSYFLSKRIFKYTM